VFASGLALTLTLAVTTSAGVDGAKFEREFKGAKTPLQRSKVAEQLSSDVAELKSWELVLADEYWNVRWPVAERITKLETKEARQKVAAAMAAAKDPNVRLQLLWAYSQSSLLEPVEFEPLHRVLKDEKESTAAKALALRAMWVWPFARPTTATINHSDEEREAIEERAAAIHAVAQPVVKGNFKAYLDFLKYMQTDPKFSKRLDPKKNDKDARLLQWLTVFGLEKLSSEEGTENLAAWEIIWQKAEQEDYRLTYRWDEDRANLQIGDVSANARTAERRKVKRETGVHLLLMPEDKSDLYFAPYEREFIQYFKLSSFIMPDGAKWGRKNDDKSYYYPIDKVAEFFKEHRRSQQGGMFGMVCVGEAAYIAMEYAKFDPDGCAFIVCIGAWPSNNQMSQGRTQGENSKRLDVKNWYLSLWYEDPNGIEKDPEKKFHCDAGELTHRFADPRNPDIYYVRDRIDAAPGVASSGLQPIIDDAYAVKAKGVTVPALFIFGEADETSNEKKLKGEFTRMFQNAKFVTMKGTSRMPWLEDPMGFLDEFELFMKEKKVWDRIEKFKEKEAEEKKGKGGKK